METYEVMRTTFAARDFTDQGVPDEVLYRILDHARFAPSGGNRQGWKVIVIKDADTRASLQDLMMPTIKAYKAMAAAGETPFNSIQPSQVSADAIANMPETMPFSGELDQAPVVLVITVDLRLVTAFDQDLPRVGVIAGASIYPFAWNILLAARNEGYGGVLTTFLTHQETAAKSLLGVPTEHAIAGVIGIGRPVKQLTKLTRKSVPEFTTLDHFHGAPLEQP